MKKIFMLVLVLAIVCGLCACATVAGVPERAEYIGYVIIPHADGEEHADIYDWHTDEGIIYAYCMDGRFIASTQIIVVLEP